MRFIARGEEIARVMEIMESDDYPDGESMAKAIVDEVADMLWFRDWWVLGALYEDVDFMDGRRGQATALFGPFASEFEARGVGQKTAGMLVPPKNWAVMKVYGLGNMSEQRAGGGFGYCVTVGCGHPAYAHSMAGSSRGHCVLCGLTKCRQYEQAKPKPRTRKLKVAA